MVPPPQARPLNPLGTQPQLTELPLSTAAWLLGASMKAVRSRLNRFVNPDGTPGARMSGGRWMLATRALRSHIESTTADEARLMMLERIVKRTAIAPRVPPVGPPPPLSAAVLTWGEERPR